MLTYDVICPLCGKVNHGLYLEETDGWMECEHCHQLVNILYSPTEGRKKTSSLVKGITKAAKPGSISS